MENRADLKALHDMLEAIDRLLETPEGAVALPRVLNHFNTYIKEKIGSVLDLTEAMKEAQVDAVNKMYGLKKEQVEAELHLLRLEIEDAKEQGCLIIADDSAQD